MASCLNVQQWLYLPFKRNPSDCRTLKNYFKNRKSEGATSCMGLDHVRGRVPRTALLCFTVRLQLSLGFIQGYVFSAARNREGFSQGTSRSIHVLLLEQIMRHRTPYADHSSGLHECQGKSWTVVCLVCRNSRESQHTTISSAGTFQVHGTIQIAWTEGMVLGHIQWHYLE